MSNSRKKRNAAQRRLGREQHTRQHQHERSADPNPAAGFVRPDIHREIRYITELAQARDSRIVSLGNLVLFSTSTRDAWLLDPEDNFALCLCRDGEPQPFRIIDAPDMFSIEWTALFAIDGEAFR